MAGGADTSAMRSSSISRLMSRSNLTGDPDRYVSIQPDLMSLRINKEINSMEKSLSSSKSGMPLRDYSAVKEFDLYRADPVCKDVDPSEINGSPFQTSDVKPDPSLLSSGMANDQSDPSKMASKMDVKPKSAISRMESKMAATNEDCSKVTSSEANTSKRNSRRHSQHSHDRRSKSVSSPAIEEPPVTSKKSKKGKKSRRKSRKSSLSKDSSSTEESPVRKTKDRQRSKRRKHRSCSSADEKPPVSTSWKGKKQSRKSVHSSKKKHRGSDDSFTEEELSDSREDKRKKTF